MKKGLSLILIITIILTMVSCRSKNVTTQVEPERIIWLIPGDSQPDTKLVLEKINEKLMPLIGAELDLRFIPNKSFEEKMKMYMASGEKYDLCFTSDWINSYDEAVGKGAFYDITDFINNSPELKSTIPDYVRKSIEYNGRMYAMPNIQIMAKQLSLRVRSDLLDKYKFSLDNVKTMDDIEPFLETIKENEPDIYPYQARWSISPWIYDEWEEFGNTNIYYNLKTDEILPLWENQEAINALKKLRSWYKKGYIRNDIDIQGDDTELYNNGKYAVCIDSWKPGIELFNSSQEQIQYTYKRIGYPRKMLRSGVSAMTAISANSSNPEKAFELLKLVNTDKELYTLICEGLEGVHYTFDSEGKIMDVENSKYNPNSDWKFGNQFNAFIKHGMNDDIWEQTKKINSDAADSNLVGFKIDKTKISTEMQNIIAINERYKGNEFIDFIVVENFEDYLEEFKVKMLQSGANKVINEISNQARDYIDKK